MNAYNSRLGFGTHIWPAPGLAALFWFQVVPVHAHVSDSDIGALPDERLAEIPRG